MEKHILLTEYLQLIYQLNESDFQLHQEQTFLEPGISEPVYEDGVIAVFSSSHITGYVP